MNSTPTSHWGFWKKVTKVLRLSLMMLAAEASLRGASSMGWGNDTQCQIHSPRKRPMTR